MIDHFDLLSGVYENAIKFKSLEVWFKLARLPQPGTLLDVGGGTGRVARALQPYFGDVAVCDLSFGMLKKGRELAELNQVQTLSEGLPFPKDSFETVIMVDAFHHIIDGQKTINELWRVTKPGGRIIMEEPDIRHPLIWLVAIGEKMALMRSKFVSPARIAALFPHRAARKTVYQSGYSGWVIIDK